MILPMVTVVVSSYNRPRLIRDALDSIFAQHEQGIGLLQVLVADDHSDAETLRVLASYGDQLQVIQPPGEPPTMAERQQGQRCAVAINAAMPHAIGDFVAFLPDDDFLLPGSLACRARFLEEHPDAMVVYGRLEACKCGDEAVGGWRLSGEYATHDRNSFYRAEPLVRAANRVDHGMIMVRRVPNLPEWPESPTGEQRLEDDGFCEVENRALANGEWFDCPDAGWLFRLELQGFGPFYSVPDFVVVKRYHAYGHRTDPTRRE